MLSNQNLVYISHPHAYRILSQSHSSKCYSTLIIFGEEFNVEALHYATGSSLLAFNPSLVQFPEHPVLKPPHFSP